MNVYEVKPMAGKILVELKTAEEELGGILLPTQSQQEESSGTVIATHSSSDLKTGQKIIFEGYDDRDSVYENGKKYIFIWEKDVMCTLGDDEEEIDNSELPEENLEVHKC